MNPPSGAPRRLIGLVDATALVVGSMIGSGVLLAIASPRTTLPGFGLVLLGIPVFFARRRTEPAA